MENKKPWQSRTILFNALVGVLGILSMFGLVPSVHQWVSEHSDMVLAGIGAVGVVLRMVTKGKVSIE